MLKIQDKSLSFTPKYACMAGSAGPTIPMSRAPMKTPTKRSIKIVICLRSTIKQPLMCIQILWKTVLIYIKTVYKDSYHYN